MFREKHFEGISINITQTESSMVPTKVNLGAEVTEDSLCLPPPDGRKFAIWSFLETC